MIVFILAVFIIGVIVVCIVLSNERKNNLERLNNRMKELNIKNISSQITAPNCTYILISNDQDKRFYIILLDYSMSFRYDEIIGFETFSDNQSINFKSTSSTLGRAAVGGILLGGVGAIVGGMSGKSKNINSASSVNIKIHTNNANKPFINLSTFNAREVCNEGRVLSNKFNWNFYINGLEVAEKIESLIANVMAQNDLNSPDTSVSSFSNADELIKMAHLLEKGLISQEEFDKAKYKILNN